jgi:hypothetical protein
VVRAGWSCAFSPVIFSGTSNSSRGISNWCC